MIFCSLLGNGRKSSTARGMGRVLILYLYMRRASRRNAQTNKAPHGSVHLASYTKGIRAPGQPNGIVPERVNSRVRTSPNPAAARVQYGRIRSSETAPCTSESHPRLARHGLSRIWAEERCGVSSSYALTSAEPVRHAYAPVDGSTPPTINRVYRRALFSGIGACGLRLPG